MHDLPDSDHVISVTSEQVLAISRPSKGDNFWFLGWATSVTEVWLELVNEVSLLEVVDLDARGGSSAEPVSVRREGQGVDLITRWERVEVSRAVKVPKDDVTILATGGAQGSIWGDGDGGNITSVANVVSLKSWVLNVPNLKFKC